MYFIRQGVNVNLFLVSISVLVILLCQVVCTQQELRDREIIELMMQLSREIVNKKVEYQQKHSKYVSNEEIICLNSQPHFNGFTFGYFTPPLPNFGQEYNQCCYEKGSQIPCSLKRKYENILINTVIQIIFPPSEITSSNGSIDLR